MARQYLFENFIYTISVGSVKAIPSFTHMTLGGMDGTEANQTLTTTLPYR